MKVKRTLLYLVLVALIQTTLSFGQEQLVLMDDINTDGKDHHSAPSHQVEFNNKMYFQATDNLHGAELWVYDGTNAPIMVADINEGTGDSRPQNLTVFNNKLYFSAFRADVGYELWVYDGINPPSLVYDIQPGTGYGYPQYLIVFNNKLCFSATNGANGTELWEYDGTNDPQMRKDINTSGTGASSYPAYLTLFKDKLYFRANNADEQNYELWEYDGTNDPKLTVEINTTGSSDVGYLCVFGDKLYFSAWNSSNGKELWEYDGTNNPSMAADIFSGPGNSGPQYLCVSNNTLYFKAYTSTNGNELWKYDGTNATIAADICEGSAHAYPGNLTTFKGKLYFSAQSRESYPGDSYYEMYVYDESNNTASIVADFNSVEQGSDAGNFFEFNDKLYFSANDGVNGSELWEYDGTTTPQLTANINKGTAGTYLGNSIVYNNKLYFRANDGVHGDELWECDGSNAPTLTDIREGGASGNPRYSCEYDGKLYFQADDGVHGVELWVKDGNNAPTVIDIFDGINSSRPQSLCVFNGKLYFMAYDTTNGYELWSYDGTSATMVANVREGSSSSQPSDLAVFNNKLYFSATDAGNDRELWSYDGTNATRAANINSSGSSNPTELTVLNNKLYFRADNGSKGYELMVCDDNNNVSLVYDIQDGSSSSYLRDLTVYNNKLFFNANDGTNGYELWEYDGTNTPVLKDIYSGSSGSNPSNFTVHNNKLYFGGDNGVNGSELMVYDGTSVELAVDIFPGSGDGSPKELMSLNNRLYFAANNGVSGQELFVYGILGPQVSTQAASNIAVTTATGNGNISDLGPENVIAHGVCWSTSPQPTTADSKNDKGATTTIGAFTADMTGLTERTTYYVRAFATDAETTSYGEEVTFTTTGETPTVTTQTTTDIIATTATANGTITDLGTADVTQHGVCWSTTSMPTTNDSKTTKGSASATGAYTSAITGLTQNTSYYLRAYATNSKGTSYGEEITFTTLVQAPTATSQAVSDITGSTATGNGNLTDLGGADVTAHGICWSTETEPTIDDTNDFSTDEGAVAATGAFTSAMTGLAKGTTFYVRAYATNSGGTVYGNEVSFTTLTTAPTVSTEAMSAIGSTSVTANGTISDLGGVDVTAYGVCYSTSPTPTIADTKINKGATTTTGAFTANLTGLTTGTRYYLRAFATNSQGTTYGEEVNFMPVYSAGNALKFLGGIGDNKDFAKLINLNVNTTANAKTTVEFWMYWDGRTPCTPFSWRYDTDKTFSLYISGGYFGFCTGNGGDLYGFTHNNSFLNKWVHVAAVFNNGTITSGSKIYINGIEKGLNQEIKTPFTRYVSPTAYIGNSQLVTSTYCFDGKIDDLRIWNGEQSASNIQSNMKTALANPTSQTGLVAYYNFNQSAGDNLPDLSANNDDGTCYYMTDSEWVTSGAMIYNSSAYAATNITKTTATANWQTNYTATKYCIDVATDASFSNILPAYNNKEVDGQDVTSLDLVGLSDNTTYYYRVRAWNEYIGATSANTSTRSFTTLMSPPGNALDFDGTNDYVSLPSVGLGGSNAITLEAWVNPNSFNDDSGDDANISSVVSAGDETALIRIGDGGNIDNNQAQFAIKAGSTAYKVNSATRLNANEWYHIVGVYTGSKINIYINGVLDGSADASGTVVTNSNNTVIGTYANGVDRRELDGQIDEVRIWNIARSATDIQTNMNQALTGNETGLVAYYNFDHTTGTTLTDNSTNSYNGTLRNMANDDWVSSGAMVSVTTTTEASDIAATSATANWNVNYTADKYYIDVATDASFANTLPAYNNKEVDGQATVSLALTGLAEETTHFYRIRAYNEDLDLTSANSNTISFTDAMDAPGYALEFDGDEYVSINSTFGLGAQNVTIEAWVYLPTTSEKGTIARLGASDTGFGMGVGQDRYDYDGNELIILVDERRWLDTNAEIGTGWHHVAFSIGSNNEINAYIDGENVYTEESFANEAVAPSTPSYIGAASSTGRIISGGKIDEVRYWSDVRTVAEIQDNMSQALVGNEAGLVAYYNFDYTSGTALTDITGNSYDGVVTNMVDADWVTSGAMTYAPKASSASNIMAHTATVNWDVNTTADKYYIDIATDANFANILPAYSNKEVEGQATVSLDLTGLTGSTGYYYRVRAYSETYTQTTDNSNVVSFTTSITPPGNALRFDGVNDYMRASGVPVSTTTNAKTTVEFWINWNGTDAIPFSFDNNYTLLFHNNDFGINTNQGDLWGMDFPSSLINKWTHIAVVFNNGVVSNGSKIYVNGVNYSLSKKATNNPLTNLTAKDEFVLGARNTGGFWFGGYMDDVRIWNGERSETEIRDNLGKELTGSETNLLAYYNLNTGSGGTQYDLTSNNSHGVGYNFASPYGWVSSGAMALAQSATAASDILIYTATANWDINYTATKYYIDVATDANFTSFVSGYQNKEIDGQATVSLALTGLSGGTPYYYRVRAYNEHTTTEGDNSNVVSFTTDDVVTETTEVEANNITVYPNPATTTLALKGNTADVAQVTLYSLDGKAALSVQLIDNSIDVSSLSAGIYLLTATNHNGEALMTERIIISE